MIIGLCGFGAVGKDTVADILVEDHGYEKFSFNVPIKELAAQVNPIVTFEVDEDGAIEPVRYNEVVARYGYDDAKYKVPEVVKFLQNIGVGVRDVLGQDTWVDAVMQDIQPYNNVVNTSVRFPNEEEAIREALGVIILVTRPGVGPLNDAVTERFAAEVEPDYIIENSGTIDELRFKVADVMRQIKET